MHIPFDPSILAVSRDIGVSTDGFSKYCFLPGSVGFDDAPLIDAVTVRTMPQNSRFRDFAALGSYSVLELRN